MAGIKRTTADKWFSDCIRERADWTCQSCKTEYTPPARGLECAHIIGRANKAVRWDELNALALCTGCHMHYTGNPLEFVQLVERELGTGAREILQEKARGIFKYNKAAIKEATEHYKDQYKKMREKRMNGFVGWLEFESFQ